jgi:anaerobic magnesium-protoporphyrin IX monomethyl ester cyclase
MNISPRGDRPDIFLFSPPPWLVKGPPLGLAALAAFLRAKGWNVSALDGNAKIHREAGEELRPLWKWEWSDFWENAEQVDRLFGPSIRRMADEAAGSGAMCVGINVVSRKEAAARIFLERLREKKPDVRVFIGGPGAGWKTSRDGLRLRAAGLFDGFIVGEGEATCAELLKRLSNGHNFSSLAGYVSADHERENDFVASQIVSDLDFLPYPDFTDFNLSDYEDPSLPVEWNRGCVARCTYCSVNDYWSVFRRKSAQRVAEEMRYLSETHGIDSFSVVDPMVNGDPKRLENICDALIGSKLKATWSAGMSPNCPVDARVFRKMASAGCRVLEFGIDSGSNRILKRMAKRYRPEQAGRMIEDAHAAGICVAISLIVGFPGETDESVGETIVWLDRYGHSIDLARSVSSLKLEDGSAVAGKPGFFQSGARKREDSGNRVVRIAEKLRCLGIPVESESIVTMPLVPEGDFEVRKLDDSNCSTSRSTDGSSAKWGN